MGELSPIHWLIVLAIIVLLFGGKKIPDVMSGGIYAFREGTRSLLCQSARVIRADWVLLFGRRGIPKIVNRLADDIKGEFRNGPGGGPQHPIPVTGPVESQKPAKDSSEHEQADEEPRAA